MSQILTPSDGVIQKHVSFTDSLGSLDDEETTGHSDIQLMMHSRWSAFFPSPVSCYYWSFLSHFPNKFLVFGSSQHLLPGNTN